MDLDPVLDDPGELMRFWLWHQKHVAVRSFTIASLAKALALNPAAVGAWLKRRAVPTVYWNPIARFFDRPSYRSIEDEARELWTNPMNHRRFRPLHKIQAKRRRWTGSTLVKRAHTNAARETTPRPEACLPNKIRSRGDLDPPPRLLKFKNSARMPKAGSSATAAVVLPWRTH